MKDCAFQNVYYRLGVSWNDWDYQINAFVWCNPKCIKKNYVFISEWMKLLD